ncbi:hypothetical protein GcM1_147003 [Golovinomyces cichoracearum]|uniref:Uncharacterized protein n=1 Tax=Golovinomyces cichoracearum TaxID=62708 RepID=A0A420JB92_9PEZI|nr:hypothetical protein GcM1_147003 [Golovinomyces cichoracearum]
MSGHASFTTASHSDDDYESLPSSEITNDTFSDEVSDAQEEWEDSLRQLDMIISMVIVPYVGKYFGRKFAIWSWAKCMHWLYPLDAVIKDDFIFRAVGAVRTAATF